MDNVNRPASELKTQGRNDFFESIRVFRTSTLKQRDSWVLKLMADATDSYRCVLPGHPSDSQTQFRLFRGPREIDKLDSASMMSCFVLVEWTNTPGPTVPSSISYFRLSVSGSQCPQSCRDRL